MAYSYVRYTGNGSTTNYTFPFPYISQDHIKVRVNGSLTTLFSFPNSSTIQFFSAPTAGQIIEIRRETPKENVIVNFTDGSVLLERDLDLLATYDLYLAQETKDGLDDGLALNSVDVWDAKSKRIGNVADPVSAQDAVTKAYADTIINQTTAAAAAAEAARVAAEIAEVAAEAALDSFDDRYLGAKAADPTLDNDGNALLTGALYFRTTAPVGMKVYDGAAWNAGYTDAALYLLLANNLSDVPNKATARSNLGLAIGVNVQGYDAATAKTNVAQSYSAQQWAAEATLTDAATITWNAATAQVAKVTLAGNRILAAPTNMQAGAFYGLLVQQDATGSRTLSWNTVYKFPSATAPTLTVSASARDFFVFRSDGTNMYLVGRSQDVR